MEDEGIGIAKDKLDKNISKNFTVLRGRNQVDITGTGLGLTVVQGNSGSTSVVK